MTGIAQGTSALQLNTSDRILVLAPHPDDESLGAGGLLQVAQEIGAKRRVLIATDGDNNPWPQRWLEKRWTIDTHQRAAWGARRRAEANAALGILGISEVETRFLGLPDRGLSALLLQADQRIIQLLQKEVHDFCPTLIIVPAMSDRHPDHSALHLLLRVALAELSVSTLVLSYGIHGQQRERKGAGFFELVLTDAQQLRKRRAIEAHTSQMALSRRRFLTYTSSSESYYDELILPTQEIGACKIENYLHLQVKLQMRRIGVMNRLLLVLEDAQHGSLRWELLIYPFFHKVTVRDLLTQHQCTFAEIYYHSPWLSISLSLPILTQLTQGFAKLESRRRNNLFVLDRTGWFPLFLN